MLRQDTEKIEKVWTIGGRIKYIPVGAGTGEKPKSIDSLSQLKLVPGWDEEKIEKLVLGQWQWYIELFKIWTGTKTKYGLRNTHNELTAKDIRDTGPSRFCKYALILIFYISPYNSIFIIKNNNFRFKNLIASQNNILYNINYFCALFLIYYISPDNSNSITKNKSPRFLRLNNILLGLNNIDNIKRRKYDLHEQKLAQYQLLLYEIGSKQYSCCVYPEYSCFHRSYVADVQYHCSYSITKLLIKENKKNYYGIQYN